MPRFLRQLAAILLFAAAPALVSAAIQLQWRAEGPLRPGEVRPETVRLWPEELLWVDARSRQQFEAGHIEGAVLLNPLEWDEQLPLFFAAWTAEKRVIVYDGNSSDAAGAIAARLREEAKIREIHILKGGYQAWHP